MAVLDLTCGDVVPVDSRPGVSRRPAPVPVAAAAASEAEVFDVESVYDEHGASLFAFAVNTLGDRGLAEDCVQETLLRAWRSGDRFLESRGSARSWVFAIARNVAIDLHRARSRRPRLVRQATEDAGSIGVDEPLAQDEGALTLDRMVLAQAFAGLSAQHREVLVEVHLHGRSYADVAAQTGVPVATLRTRSFHGLRALRQQLQEIGEHRA